MAPLMFAIQEAPQVSMCYSLFELVYGHQPRGLLKVARMLGTEARKGNIHSKAPDRVKGTPDLGAADSKRELGTYPSPAKRAP